MSRACPGGSTGTSRPFAALRAMGAPLRGGSLLWTTWTIRSAEAWDCYLTTLQQITTDLERHRHAWPDLGFAVVVHYGGA